MDEHILQLFQRFIINPNIPEITSELVKIYSDLNSLPSFFSIVKNCKKNDSKEIKFLAYTSIEKVLEYNQDGLTDIELLNTLNSEFAELFEKETDFEILHKLVHAATFIFPYWPEIFDFINMLIERGTEQSNQLAMLLLSQLPEELIDQLNERYIEMCKLLLENSLQEQTNLLSALALFSSLSKLTTHLDIVSSSFSPFYSLFLLAFQHDLMNNDETFTKIAEFLTDALDFVEFSDPTPVLTILFDMAKSDEIISQNKISIFQIIKALLKSKSEPSFFEPLLQLGILICASLFDEQCYIENLASSFSFKFLKYFSDCENFDEVLLRNLKTDSNELIFASLTVISSLTQYISNMNSFLPYILPCCEAPVHSIAELAFSILIDNYDHFSASALSSIYSVILKCLIPSSNHIELLKIIVHLMIQLIYNIPIPIEAFDPTLESLITLYQSEAAIQARDHVIICFSALLEGFDRDAIEGYLPHFVPLIIESMDLYCIECPSSQRAAVEALSVCISYSPQHFTENIDQYISLLISWLSDSEDRQHIESAIFSLKTLLNIPNLNDENLLARILEVILNYLNTEIDDLYDIDYTSIRFKAIQLYCLGFINRLIKSFIKNDIVLSEQFIDSVFSCVKQTLCTFLIKNPDCQKKTMKSIFHICYYFHDKHPQLIFQFFEYFISIFESDFQLSLTFFKGIFDSNISLDIPTDFFESLLTLSFTQLSQSNFQILSLLESLANRFEGFPIVEFNHFVKENFDALEPNDVANAISVFCKYLLKIVMTEDKKELVNDMMTISFKALKLCTSFSIPPYPIHLFSILVNNSIQFNDQTISQFYLPLIEILNAGNESKNYFDTVYESILFLLKVIIQFPQITFPFDSFFPKIFDLLPPSVNFDQNIEIYRCIEKLPTSPNFSKMSPYFGNLFGSLVRTIALQDEELAGIGLDSRIVHSMTGFCFQMYRSNKSNDKLIEDILQGNSERIEIVKNRFELLIHKHI